MRNCGKETNSCFARPRRPINSRYKTSNLFVYGATTLDQSINTTFRLSESSDHSEVKQAAVESYFALANPGY